MWKSGPKQLALSYLAVLSFDTMLVNTKAQRVSSPLAPSPSLPTHHEVSQARAFICCAHYSFLPLFGICTCIVQFCWQNSSSHFWSIYKTSSGPSLGSRYQVRLSASRITGWPVYMKHCWDILLSKRNHFLILLLLCISSQKPLWRRFSEEKVGWAIKECDISYKCVSFPGTVTTSHHSSSYKSKSSSTVTSTSGHSSGSSSGAVAYRQQRPGAHFQQQQPLNLSQVSQLRQILVVCHPAATHCCSSVGCTVLA